MISLLNREENTKNPLQLCWTWASSVKVEFKVEGSGAEWIETLEALEASVEVMMVMTLLALRVHGVLAVVELGSHLWKNITKDIHLGIAFEIEMNPSGN